MLDKQEIFLYKPTDIINVFHKCSDIGPNFIDDNKMDNKNKEKIVQQLDELNENDVDTLITYIETLKEKCHDDDESDDHQYFCPEAGP